MPAFQYRRITGIVSYENSVGKRPAALAFLKPKHRRVTTKTDSDIWPDPGISRVPYQVYAAPDIYAQERERVFMGPAWHFLCLDCEIPNRGDYKSTFVGDIPVIVVRARDGSVNGLENRCSHRGATLCLEKFGNLRSFSCVYHGWSYDLDGNLKGVPFERGVNGGGGMPEDFRKEDNGLRRLRIATHAGVVFGTFHDDTPPLADYLEPAFVEKVARVMPRAVKVLGYNTQVMHNNWKLYAENVRDPYHASILHLFFTTFKMNRLTQRGEILVNDEGGHHVSTNWRDPDASIDTYREQDLRAVDDEFALNDPTLLDYQDEFDDNGTLQILSVFPGFVMQQIYNCLAVRQIVPKGPDLTEVNWTYYGFEDDADDLTTLRLKQANLIGPAGYISMEDGAVGEFVQRTLPGAQSEETILMMGGHTAESQTSRATETSIRGFWKAWRRYMEI